MLAVINFVTAQIILPSVLVEARIQASEMIEEHSLNPHPVSVSRREFQLIVDEIRAFRADFTQRLEKLSEKLDR